ncbi:hypothetical protein HMPREF1154_1773 [Capnocytophaga sp. CM59]|nr:hypothetical protein HMPREF1154_1773 [Capnocytophaga sp. CM59]
MKVLEKLATGTSIFCQDEINLLKYLQGSKGDILQVTNRGRN